MSRRDHNGVSRAPYADDFRMRSPAQQHTFASPYLNSHTTYSYPAAAIPPPSSILSGNGPPSHLASGGTKTYVSRPAAPASSSFSVTDALQSVREISPPPLRRSQTRIELQHTTASNPTPTTTPQSLESSMQTPQLATPPSRTSRASLAPKKWNKADLTSALQDLLKDVRQDHSRLVSQSIEATTPAEWRVQHGANLFEGLGIGPIPERKGKTMKIKFKVGRQ